jgi:HEAT repeat protein
LSAGPTDRPAARPAALLALAAVAALLPGGAPARAAEDPDRPVFFKDPDRATAAAILESLNLFGDPSPNNRERARDRLFAIGYWAVPRLREAVREGKGAQRSNALLVLGRIADRRALPDIRAALRDESSEGPPAVAALVLGRLRDDDEAAMAGFRAAVTGPENERRRIATCLALAKLHRKRGAEAGALLEQAVDLRSANNAVTYAAVLALGFFRSRAVEALPDGSGFQPAPRIREALADRRAGMRHSAILALALAHDDSLHPIFLKAFRKDGEIAEVRLAALLALGRNSDAATTALLLDVAGGATGTGAERRMAAHLLSLRAGDLAAHPGAIDALRRVIASGREPEVAAAALVALGGVDDPAVPDLVLGRLADRSPVVRAAAGIASLRFRKAEDLARARDAIRRRLEAVEQDAAAKADLQAAAEAIAGILKDREEAAKGYAPAPRPPVAWKEVGSTDLFLVLGRDHRQRIFDLVNQRVLQILGIESLFPYRPYYDPDEPAAGLGGTGTAGATLRDRVTHNETPDQYDLRVELSRRPYYGPEDDPEIAPSAVPRDPK